MGPAVEETDVKLYRVVGSDVAHNCVEHNVLFTEKIVGDLRCYALNSREQDSGDNSLTLERHAMARLSLFAVTVSKTVMCDQVKGLVKKGPLKKQQEI